MDSWRKPVEASWRLFRQQNLYNLVFYQEVNLGGNLDGSKSVDHKGLMGEDPEEALPQHKACH